MYEERAGGVYNVETGDLVKRGMTEWKVYERWLAEQTPMAVAADGRPGGAAVPVPHVRVREKDPLPRRRAEARARVRGNLTDTLMRHRAKVAVDGAVLWADIPHILFYLLLAQRANVPAGLSIPDVQGQPFLMTDARLRTLLTRIGVRYLNYFTAAADRVAAVNASADPELVDTTVDAIEEGEVAPSPVPVILP